MATSTEKLAAMRPQVTQELLGLITGSEVGPLLRPVLGLLQPQLDRRVDAWLALPPEQIDKVLGDLAGMLASLRSDDAEPIDLAPTLIDELEAPTPRPVRDAPGESAGAKCDYNEPWVGKCTNLSPCEKHEGTECVYCGRPAVGGCPNAGSFVCGIPLCASCGPYCRGHG